MQMTSSLRLTAAILLLASLAGCQGGRSDVTQTSNGGEGDALSATPIGACALASPLRQLAAGLDRPGDARFQDTLSTASTAPAGSTSLYGPACADNTAFRIGSGVHDMTGPAGDSISAGYENVEHVLRGIHLRQFARAFAMESSCDGKRVIMAVSETAFVPQGIRQTVMQMIADDPELSPHYGQDNVMLSATHTHSGPGGEAHHAAYNLFRLGYDALVHEIYSTGLFRAIQQAHRNLEAHPEPGTVRLAMGELLDVNRNRSEPAYANNPVEERAQWLDQAGEEVRVNKRMVQLRLDRADGSPIGLLNWFGVHTTSVGIHEPLISSDNKGIAAYALERMLGTDYLAPDGEDRFVAAFAQSDEGDSSPNLCFPENPFPSLSIGCGVDTLESTAASGVKQLARAIELYDQGGTLLRGGLDSRLVHVRMDDVEITDPVVLASLQHPPELDSEIKRTCTAALGFSMAAGAEDNPGPSQEGISCANVDAAGALAGDIQTVLDTIAGYASGAGYLTLPARTVGGVVGCGLTTVTSVVPGLPDADYSCQAEKPILFPIGTTELISNADLPLQIVTLGQLAIVALPWEVTTTSARRIRATVLAELEGSGIEHAVVAGLSNDFVQYLTTREEYATQQYEGGSTHFGPWTLAAVQQSLRPLAISLREGTAAPEGVDPPLSSPGLPPRTPYIAADFLLPGTAYGDVTLDANPLYNAGDTVQVEFASAHPRNDALEKLNRAYLLAEREVREGQWEVVARERDPEMIMRWHPTPEAPVLGQTFPLRTSAVEAIWHLPRNLPAGRYRIRHEGTAVQLLGARTE
ncbi:MAG: neutral/alkaline non-lysosomal ceramidase N-terminal domain-containing protein, partial [Oceanococcaceae bacterium]